LYVGSPQMEVVRLESAQAGKALLTMLLSHATSPSFTYFHAWDLGDVLIWDNTQTLHHSYPYDSDGTNKRELYRTQARMRLSTERGSRPDGSAPSKEEL